MDAIHNNPFRILGLPVTASTREITKRVSDLEMYAEIGKTVRYDTDYHFLSPIERTVDTIKNASNQIETMESRFFYSLFWFWEGNSGDELALEVLKEEKVGRAVSLLKKQLSSSMDTSRAYSSAKNLAILYMALARNHNDSRFDVSYWETFSDGVMWAGKSMQVDFLSQYADLVAGKHFIFDYDKVVESFIEEIIRTAEPRLNNSNEMLLPQFIAKFSTFPDRARRRVTSRFTAKDIETIDNAIALSERRNKAAPDSAYLNARELRQSTEIALKSLCKILGVADYTYQSYADKLALATNACGAVYYNYHIENETGIDPGTEALEIAKYARSIATTDRTKNQIDEGIKVVSKWIDGKAEREKQKKVSDSIVFIVDQLNGLPDIDNIPLSSYISLLKIVKDLLKNCKVPLNKMYATLGPEDEMFLDLSNAVACRALGLCIAYANVNNKPADILEIFNTISTFAMKPDTRDHFNKNRRILRNNMKAQAPKKSGCYVATMVYGDYDSHQVMVLRRYRDEVLEKGKLGRLFIRVYYRLSPGFVERFGRFRFVHRVIRYGLDRIVRRLA